MISAVSIPKGAIMSYCQRSRVAHRTSVSIPKGAIMSMSLFACFSWYLVSIPKGAIMSIWEARDRRRVVYSFNSKRCDYESSRATTRREGSAVSIPKGAIMSLLSFEMSDSVELSFNSKRCDYEKKCGIAI